MYIYQKMYHTEIVAKLLQGVCWTTYLYDLRLKKSSSTQQMDLCTSLNYRIIYGLKVLTYVVLHISILPAVNDIV